MNDGATMRRWLGVCAVILVLGAPAAASAKVELWKEGGSGTITTDSLLPRLDDAEGYTERYNFSAELDNGGHVGFTFIISNLGWGDGHGAARVNIEIPGKDKYKSKKKVSSEKWSYSKKELALTMPKTKLRHPEDGVFKFTHDGDVKAEITFESLMPMWQPGNGKIEKGNTYYLTQLLAPRARVTGHVKIDGKKIEVSSKRGGYGEHTATNVAPYKLANRFAWFRKFHEDVTLVWKYADLTSDFGGGEVAWVLVGYKDKIVFSSPDAGIKFGRIQPDGPSGYKVPKAVQIEAKDGKDSIKLVQKGEKYRRDDLMESWGGVAKSVASAVTEPFRFVVKTDYSLRMTIQGATARISGEDKFTMDILND